MLYEGSWSGCNLNFVFHASGHQVAWKELSSINSILFHRAFLWLLHLGRLDFFSLG